MTLVNPALSLVRHRWSPKRAGLAGVYCKINDASQIVMHLPGWPHILITPASPNPQIASIKIEIVLV